MNSATARDQSRTHFTSAGYLASLVDRNGNTRSMTARGGGGATGRVSGQKVSRTTKTNSSGVTQAAVATTYDSHGNALTTVTSYATNPNVTVTRTFDALNRLATLGDSARSYTYDLNGDTRTMTAGGGGGAAGRLNDAYAQRGNRPRSRSQRRERSRPKQYFTARPPGY